MLFHTTAAHMEEIISESYKKTILLDFYASWCAPCRALEPMVDDLSDLYEQVLSAYSINTDTDPELADRFAVSLLPTILFLRDGTIVEKLEKDITKKLLEDSILLHTS